MEADEKLSFTEHGTRTELVADTTPGHPPVIYLRGEVDFGQADELRRLIVRAGTTDRRVTVDLADTTFIDASIVGVLADARAGVSTGLRVRGATGVVERVFRLTRTQHLLAG